MSNFNILALSKIFYRTKRRDSDWMNEANENAKQANTNDFFIMKKKKKKRRKNSYFFLQHNIALYSDTANKCKYIALAHDILYILTEEIGGESFLKII